MLFIVYVCVFYKVILDCWVSVVGINYKVEIDFNFLGLLFFFFWWSFIFYFELCFVFVEVGFCKFVIEEEGDVGYFFEVIE